MSSTVFGSGFNASSIQDDPFSRMGQEFRALRRKVFDLEFKLSDLQHQIDLRDAPGYRAPGAGASKPFGSTSSTPLSDDFQHQTDQRGDESSSRRSSSGTGRLTPGPSRGASSTQLSDAVQYPVPGRKYQGGTDKTSYLEAWAEIGMKAAGLTDQDRHSGNVLPGLNITAASGQQFYRPGFRYDWEGSERTTDNSSEPENPATPDLEAEDAERQDLRGRILPQVRAMDPEADAERITEMIFELDLDDIRPLVTDQLELQHRVEEATRVADRTGHPRSWVT